MFSKFSVKKPYTVLVGVVLVIVLGVVSLTRMTTDLLPDMSFPYALVITTDIGATPETVEKDVTAPIEAAMATTSNIKSISSMSYNSYSMVVLEYEQNANMDSILIEIQQNLDQLSGNWGDTVGSPMILQIDPDMMPIMIAAVDMDGMTATNLSDFVDNELMPQLESVEGVASVSATGSIEETIEITLNQNKIDNLNQEVRDSIDKQFLDAQKELDDASEQVSSGQQALDENTDQLSEAINSTLAQRDELYKTEEDLKKQLEDLQGQQETLIGIQDAINGFMAGEEYKKITDTAASLAQYKTMLEAAQQVGDAAAIAQLEMAVAGYEAGLAEANAALAANFAFLSEMGVTVRTYEDLPAATASVGMLLTQINTGIASIETGLEQVQEGKIALSNALDTLNANAALAAIQIGTTSAELANAQEAMEQAQSSLDNAMDSAHESADLNGILTIDTISGLLTAQNFNMPAGYAADGDTSYLVRVGDSVKTIEDLENLVLMDLGMDGIESIHLSDVADVKLVDNTAETYAIVNGNPGIMLSMEKQTNYSTGDVTDALLERFEMLEKNYEGLHLSVLMNQGVYIDIIVQSVLQNMIFGAVLAIIVLLMFLKEIKSTVIIAFSIPLSVIFAVVLMYFTNISLNIISMSGLALGIGMLVDNSIVVIENIYRLRSEGYSIRKAAVEGASQVSGAIIASTLTTVSVFAPIIFTEGITRQLFVDMALTIAFTLSASLIMALTFVPAAASGFLKKARDIRHPWFDAVKSAYGRFLKGCLRFKPVVFIVSIVLLVGSAALALSKGLVFMNMDIEADQMSLTVGPKEDEKFTFEELTQASDEVLDILYEIEGIETIGAMAGGGGTMSMFGGGSDTVSMYILLDPESDRSLHEIRDEIIEKTKDLDCYVNAQTSSMDFTSLFGSGLSIEITGNDIDQLQKLAAEVSAVVEKVEGTIDVEDGLDEATPEFRITVDKEKAAEYKYTVAQVFQLVYAEMASSMSVTTISNDIKDYAVYLQTEEQADTTLDMIKNLSFTYINGDGEEEEILLSEICTFEETTTLSTIRRQAQNRYLTVSCGIDEGYNVTLVSNAVKEALEDLEVPEGYSVKMAGEDETINEAMGQMLLMMLLAIIFIYMIMVAQFQSLLSPFIIIFTIPLAFTGGFFALFFTGTEVSIIAMLGFIMLAGLIVNNGIVLVDYINQARKEGMSKKEAIIDAGKIRMRPILMTALTTILAMFTMALGVDSGSEMMQPMAITMIGGLIYGTLLTLIVIPCIYDAFHREKSMVEEEL